MFRQHEPKKTSRVNLIVEAQEDRVLRNGDDCLVVTHSCDDGSGLLRTATECANAANISDIEPDSTHRW